MAHNQMAVWMAALLTALAVGTSCAPAAPTAKPAALAPSPAAPARSTAAEPGPSHTAAPLVPSVDLKVGSVLTIGESSLYIALEKGYFRQEGLNVEIVPFQTATDMIAPLSTGQLGIGVGGIAPGLFNAVALDVGVRIVAGAATLAPGRSVSLVARKDLVESGQLNDYVDLRGKALAASSSLSQTHIIYERALERAGLSLDDARIVNLGFPETVTAFGNGAVDVAYLPEPFATRAVESGLGVRWKAASDVKPNGLTQVWMYSQNLVDEQTEAGRRFMVALVRGARDYEDAVERGRDRDAMVAAISKHTPVKDPALYDKMVFIKVPPSGEVDLESMQRDLEWFRSHGAVKDAPDLARAVDRRFADYAVERLGPYR